MKDRSWCEDKQVEIRQAREQFLTEARQVQANINACDGALEVLGQLLADSPVVVDFPKDEPA